MYRDGDCAPGEVDIIDTPGAGELDVSEKDDLLFFSAGNSNS